MINKTIYIVFSQIPIEIGRRESCTCYVDDVFWDRKLAEKCRDNNRKRWENIPCFVEEKQIKII